MSFRFMDAAVCTNPGTSDPEMLVAPVGDGFKYARGGHPSCIVPAGQATLHCFNDTI